MSTEYAVIIEKFAESHFIKLFEKKHKKNWEVTLRAILAELQRVGELIGRNAYLETICDVDGVKIVKMEFRISGPGPSRHTSGNRCIVALRAEITTAFILLVYAKTDVRGRRETEWWKSVIRDNYPQYKRLL